jgi:FGGY-family pentulose kinase
MREHVIAVDVGTGSARAGLFDRHGRMLARADHPIVMHRPKAGHAEHQSDDIWAAVCRVVQQVRRDAGLPAAAIAAIGFDGTCSLVVRDVNGVPLSVTEDDTSPYDTISWMDHRAIDEALACNSIDHPALAPNNGHMSPEMQIPKLMWLKKHLESRWNKVGYLFDLADFLTWKATGNNARSACTLTAKWNYMAHETQGWSAGFLAQAGLSDLQDRGRLPDLGLPVGHRIAPLSALASADLGLDPQCLVGPGLVDAYAGVLGSLGRYAGEEDQIQKHFALVGGTSSCVVALSRDRKAGAGLWGPYFGALMPDFWLVEGGQSASGALLDYVVRMHASGGEPDAARHRAIIDRIDVLRQSEGASFAAGLHVLPDFHGNRSPFGHPQPGGVVTGLSLDMSFDGLCKLYFRTAVGIAFGMRQILEQFRTNGYQGESLHLAGGHMHNALLVRLYGEICGYDLVLPTETIDVVLLGNAIAASVTGGLHADLPMAGKAMAFQEIRRAHDGKGHAAFARDYDVFKLMQRQRDDVRAVLSR